MRIKLILFLSILNLACHSSCENKDEHKEEPKQKELEFVYTPLFNVLHSEEECRILQKKAHQGGCIDDKGLRALQILKAAPVCTAENQFSYWEPCEHAASREIREILEQTEECPKTNGTGNCALEILEFHPRKASESSRGQRIMVIDVDLDEIGSWRHKSRILDVLVPSAGGEFESVPVVKTKIPKAMKMVIELLDSRYPWMSPKSFVAIERLYRQKFSNFDKSYPRTHGFQIFNHLAEYNPKAEFVLVPQQSLSADDLCALAHEKEVLKRIRQTIKNQTRSIIDKIKNHEINYINMSFGRTVEMLFDERKLKCQKPSDERLREVIKIYLEEFFWPLSSIENVIVVQANAESLNELLSLEVFKEPTCSVLERAFWLETCSLNEKRSFNYDSIDESGLDYLTDCVNLPNRLRVGKISAIRPDISDEGTEDLTLIDDKDSQNALKCTDIYINQGAKIRRNISLELPPKEDWSFTLWESVNGIGAEPVLITGSSNVAPVAISYLIQLKRMHPELTPKQLLKKAKSGGIIKDPLMHELHLFNVFGSKDFDNEYIQ